MATGILVDCFFYELGHSQFVHSFFSTISYHLEKEGWGTKYPLLMKKLYSGLLNWEDASAVKLNLNEIEQELTKYSTEQVIWKIEDLSKKPPWGNTISSNVTNLANYFAAPGGKTFFEVIHAALNTALKDKCDLKIHKL